MKKLSVICILIALELIPKISVGSPQAIVNRPIGISRGLVVIAPAKKYLMQERLFEGLAQSLSKQGLVVVRFNWDSQTLTDSSLELQRAALDIQAVVSAAQRYFRVKPQNTVIISKSFSTKALGPSLQLAKAHILMTPNCSAEQPFLSTYSKIIENKNLKTSIFISNEDPYCDVKQIHQAFIQLKNTPSLYLTHGDHNFVLQTQGQNANPSPYIYHYQDSIIQMITTQVFTDLF